MYLALLLITLFIIKHFIIDFPLQGPYQYLNKGTYGHPGGLLHSALHTLGSLVVFMLCGITAPHFLIPLVVEYIVHYHTDWAKVQITKRFNWSHREPDGLKITSPWYFHALGADQLIHYITYVGMVLTCLI